MRIKKNMKIAEENNVHSYTNRKSTAKAGLWLCFKELEFPSS